MTSQEHEGDDEGEKNDSAECGTPSEPRIPHSTFQNQHNPRQPSRTVHLIDMADQATVETTASQHQSADERGDGYNGKSAHDWWRTLGNHRSSKRIDQDPRYFLNQAMVAGQAAFAAAMLAPSIPVCCRRKPCPAPG